MDLDSYLSKYAESHGHPTNVVLHHLCIPLIGWSVLALSHTFELSETLRMSHLLALMTVLGYLYLRDLKLILIILMCQGIGFLSFQFVPELRTVSIVGFVAGWIGQFYGHKLEGKKPAFTEELIFILIGPIWVFKRFL